MRHIYLTISLLMIGLTLFTGKANAGHISGAGNITWTCVGPDRYEVKVSVYRDCTGIPASPSLNIGCKSSGSIGNITKKQIGSTNVSNVTPTCNSTCTQCGNSQCQFNYGYEKYTNTYIVDLSNANCCKVKFSYWSCCRSNGLTYCSSKNLYIESWFDYCKAKCDNSPQFKSAPKLLACKNQGYKRNLRAYDTDTNSAGQLIDSLSYELSCPMTGPNGVCKGSSIFPCPNCYNCQNPIAYKGSTPNLPYPFGFHFNSVNGQLKFTPTKNQSAPLAFKVNEYRDANNDGQKELIGQVLRESQITVLNCKPNNNPSVTGIPCSDSLKNTTTTCAGKLDTFEFCTNDTDLGDTVTLSFNRGTLPDSATWRIKDTQAQYPTGNLIWQPKPSDVSQKPYQFTLKAKDDVCPVNGRVVEPFEINVNPQPKANFYFDSLGCGRYKFVANPLQGDNLQFEWDGKGNINASQDSFIHQFSKPGKFPVTLTVKGGGCQTTYRDTVQVDSFLRVNMALDTSICKGGDIQLGDSAKDNRGPVSYEWHDSVKGVAKRTFEDLQKDTFMTLSVTDAFCTYKDSIYVNVLDNPAISLRKDKINVCEKDSLLLNVDSSYATYTWNTGESGYQIYADSQGFYQVTAIDTFGCSSKDSTNVKTLKADTIQVSDTSCKSYTWQVSGQTYYQSGIYRTTEKNTQYCDSTASYKLDLTILKTSDTTIKAEACDQFTVPSQDTTYRVSGNYTDTLINNEGCDSLINIDLTVNQSDTITDSLSKCGNYTWPVNGNTYDQSGNYTETLTNQDGCDSIRNLQLTLNPNKQNKVSLKKCDRFKIPGKDTFLNQSGTYYDTLQTAKECDSVITFDLTIIEVDTGVKQNGTTLKAIEPDANYQWLDCDQNYKPVNGATQQSFSPDSNGRFAVKLMNQGCVDTSECYSVSGVGFVNNDFGFSLQVYPNPAEDHVNVKLGSKHQAIQVTLMNNEGKRLKNKTYQQTQHFTIQLTGSPGYYFLELSSENGKKARLKLLKE